MWKIVSKIELESVTLVVIIIFLSSSVYAEEHGCDVHMFDHLKRNMIIFPIIYFLKFTKANGFINDALAVMNTFGHNIEVTSKSNANMAE